MQPRLIVSRQNHKQLNLRLVGGKVSEAERRIRLGLRWQWKTTEQGREMKVWRIQCGAPDFGTNPLPFWA